MLTLANPTFRIQNNLNQWIYFEKQNSVQNFNHKFFSKFVFLYETFYKNQISNSWFLKSKILDKILIVRLLF